jgi:Lrp/AsnC family transcriptional regulator for asnA, asnC and gidA
MLDKTDRNIISFLQYDGRMPYTTIASELGITETTVRRRVNQLTDNGKLKIVAIVEPQDLGFNEAAMIGISVMANRIAAVVEEITQLPEVTYLFQAAGEFDLFVEVYCKDRTHFVSFLNNKLQQIEGVLSIQSFMILEMHKLSYHWGQAAPPKIDHQPSILPE